MSILRNLFLQLSTNAWMRNFVVGSALGRRVARRFVAGETLADAIAVVKKLNQQGTAVTFDQLGESVTTEAEAREAKEGYLHALSAIAANQVRSQVSVKLTQMGLDLNTEFCRAQMREILRHAQASGVFVTIDMEDSAHTQATLDLFAALRAEFANVGIVLQSYLYRSEADLRALIALGANVRLCKGAYKEPATVAFPAKSDVDANYLKLAQLFFDAPASDAYLDLATHDEKIIAWAKAYTTQHQVARNRFEFQMLYGIRADLQRQLTANGYTMRVYVPYGTHWYPYFMRRLAERPANVIFLVSNLFR